VTSVQSPAAVPTRSAAAAVALGGLAMVVLWVPFTLAHGPTSYNDERVVAGMTMIGWGLLLGVVPNVLVATGLVLARGRLARSGGTAWALGWVIAALAAAYVVALALALVPQEASDGFDGYRIYGLVAHVAVGLGWVVVASRISNFAP
jgi:hypothetical protein